MDSDSLLQHVEPRMFAVPERTLIGDGSSAELAAGLVALGCGSGVVAVVADAAVLDLGLAEPMLLSLRTAGFDPQVLKGVAGEPTVEDARIATEQVRCLSPVAVVGIGGGSALDLAKLVAVTASRSEDVAAYFGVRDNVRREIALAAVPTTAGTGAEATRIAMLSADKRKVIVSSTALIPDLVALDPNLVLSLPPSVTAATGLDALCHAIEALLSTNRSPLSIANSRQGLRLVSHSLLRSYEQPGDIKARRGVLYGSHFAGRGLNAGVVLGHSIGYTIANRTAIAHGISCAMALPYCLRDARAAAESTLADIACDVTGRGDIDEFFDWIDAVNRALGVPMSLPDVGIAVGAPEMAAECLERYPRPNSPAPLELPKLTAIYEAMARGRPALVPTY